MPSQHSTFRVRADFGHVVLSENTNSYALSNESATFVLDQLEAGVPHAELATALSTRYSISYDQASTDLSRFFANNPHLRR